MTSRATIGVLMLLALGVRCHAPSLTPAGRLPAAVGGGAYATLDEHLAASDPLAFLKKCHAHCARTVLDYRARHTKRESIRGELSPEQEMDVLFRAQPFSVALHWLKNAGRAERVVYVGGRWVENGKDLALIHPSGVLGLLVPGGVKRDIHGPEAMRAARHTIDQFGFTNTLDLLIQNCERAAGDAGYGLRYVGLGKVDGRATYVFERRLPYDGPGSGFPDRLLRIDIDREWLAPTAGAAYADDNGKVLLAEYRTTSVELNVGLTDEDFGVFSRPE